MPPTQSRSRSVALRRWSLWMSAAWGHRWGALAWAAGAGGFLAYFGVAYQVSVGSYPGGAAAFGAAAAPVAVAMRPLSGVAERLDTYGGYVSYHNMTMAAFLLSLWAVLQGARAVRGWEERGAMAVWLSAHISRARVAVEQWIGVLVALVVIAMGVAVGLGVGCAAAGEPNWGGSAVVALEMSLLAAAFFAIAMLTSQFTATARAGAGLTTMGMVAMYLFANMSTELGSFAWLRFASPFFYYQQSSVLIPGHSVDAGATLVLVAFAVLPVIAAALAFQRRDLYAAVLGRPDRIPQTQLARPVRVNSLWRRDVWLADLRSQWIALLLWTLGSALLMFVIVSAASQVVEIWQSSELIKRLFERVPGSTIVDQYMTYVTIIAALVPVAFVVSEAARWVADLTDGRAEITLAVTGSRVRVVLEWAMSTMVGVVIVVAAVMVGTIAGARAAGIELDAEKLVRTAADGVLLGAAMTGVALFAVVVFRSGVAVGILGGLLGLSFFVSIMAPMFNWPEWIVRLSPFDAFGTPYSSVPRPSGIALLAGLALAGGVAAAFVAERRSSLTA